MTERTDSVAAAPADVPALQVTDLLKHYADADRNVFDGISFSVPKGKVLVIVGPSGSGKSTLLRAIAGLEPIQGGTIALDGQADRNGQAREREIQPCEAARVAAHEVRHGVPKL